MKNRDIEAAWAYHNGTKHSYESVRGNRHYLDWENQPLLFKIYPQLAPMALDPHLSSSGMPALTAISARNLDVERESIPTSQTLAEILFLSAGITRRRAHGGGEVLFRAAACTGALYHIDLYRLDTEAQAVALGLQELLERDSVVLVEWGERFPNLWPMDRVEVAIRAIDDGREFTITRLTEPRV